MAKITKILFGSFIVLIISGFNSFIDNKIFAAGCVTPQKNFVVVQKVADPSDPNNVLLQVVNAGTTDLSTATGSIYCPYKVDIKDSNTGAVIKSFTYADPVDGSTFVSDYVDVSNGAYEVQYAYINTSGSSISMGRDSYTVSGEGAVTTGTAPITSTATSGGTSGTSTPSVDTATAAVKATIQGLYFMALPIAILIAVIKIILAIMKVAISSGDPNTLNEAKDEAYSTLMGLLVILGAVTLITMLGKALGL